MNTSFMSLRHPLIRFLVADPDAIEGIAASRVSGKAHQALGGSYVTTTVPRPSKVGTYVTTNAPQANNEGSYVTTAAQPSGAMGTYVSCA